MGLSFSTLFALTHWLRTFFHVKSACDPSLATVAVDRLERRGLVVRVPDATDRRVRRVHLSPAGDVLVQGVWRQMAQATPLARLNDQQLAGLQEILDAMLGQRE